MLGLVAPSSAEAAAVDYRFEAVEAAIPRGVGVVVHVRILDARGQSVGGVQIDQPRIDSAAGVWPVASHPAFFQPGLEYGVYAFRADFPTDGFWTLNFQAKPWGETTPIPAKVVFKVGSPGSSSAVNRPVQGRAPVSARAPFSRSTRPPAPGP